MKVLIQAGHENTTTGQTGAPEERANNIRIRNRLGQILISKGFQVFLCDANFKSQDNFNLALALHCDANYAGNEGGGFVDYPDADLDGNNAESKRIKEAIESEYFKNSGIRNVPSRSNPNTKRYYWWSDLSSSTPCVILEMGESIDPHDKVILADTDRVSNAIARGICKAFNVNFDIPVPSPVPPQVDNSLLITQLRNTISEKNDTINRLTAESITLKAKIIKYETLLDQIARSIEAVRV